MNLWTSAATQNRLDIHVRAPSWSGKPGNLRRPFVVGENLYFGQVWEKSEERHGLKILEGILRGNKTATAAKAIF